MKFAKEEFKATIDGKEVELVVKTPDKDAVSKANIFSTKVFGDAMRNGAMVKLALEECLKKQGIWNDEKDLQYKALSKQLRDAAFKLQNGNIKLKEARTLALQMRQWRSELLELITIRSAYDSNTAEGQSENARFNYLLSRCLVYKDNGNPVFNTYDDLMNNVTEDYVINASMILYKLMYDKESSLEKNLPENKFLSEWKFVDDKLRLVNEDGHLIDEKGRLINEDGRLVNEKDELINIDGNLITEDGNFVVEAKPFLDDDGNPIIKN